MSAEPSGSLDAEPSKATVSGTAPLDGVAVARATGARFVVVERMRRIGAADDVDVVEVAVRAELSSTGFAAPAHEGLDLARVGQAVAPRSIAQMQLRL